MYINSRSAVEDKTVEDYAMFLRTGISASFGSISIAHITDVEISAWENQQTEQGRAPKHRAHMAERNTCVTPFGYPCVMDVNEAAVKLGVSPRRVRALISEGKVLAHRSGKKWKVEALPVSRSRRPLSPTSRAQLAKALHSRSLKGLEGQARARTALRLNILRTSGDPAAILLDWWGGKADEKDAYVRNLLERALAGDAAGVRDTLRRRQPAYLATAERLSDRIDTERRIQGLTRKDLAERAGVDLGSVLDLERGRPTRTGTSRRVLKALDITPSALPPIGASS